MQFVKTQYSICQIIEERGDFVTVRVLDVGDEIIHRSDLYKIKVIKVDGEDWEIVKMNEDLVLCVNSDDDEEWMAPEIIDECN